MLKRFVKLEIKKGEESTFVKLYAERQQQISSFSGCREVQLFNNLHAPSTFFTFSIWDSEEDLNAYRNSDFFKETWSAVKPLFAERAQAWSLVLV